MGSPRVFVVADTHLGHEKASHFRPFSTREIHDEFVIDQWNSVVNPSDTVWHLGDVFFGGKDNHRVLERLNGYKHLVLGNHDVYPIEIYRLYFNRIAGAAVYKNCILTHIPVHPDQFYRFKLNIHGHTHNYKLNDSRYVCVSLEQTEYKPVLMAEIRERLKYVMA